MRRNLLGHLNQIRKVLFHELGEPIILEIDVDDVGPIRLEDHEIPRFFIKNERFPALANPGDNAIRLLFESHVTINDRNGFDIGSHVSNNGFDNVVIHHFYLIVDYIRHFSNIFVDSIRRYI